jgi:phosphate ABC transporter, permease protein PstC
MRDKIFNIIGWIFGLTSLLLLAGFLCSLLNQALPALNYFGFFEFYGTSVWDSREEMENYGALSFIFGSILTALLALIIAIPFSLSLLIFSSFYVRKRKAVKFVNSLIDFATIVPSIIWGIWGFYTVRPILDALHIGNQGYSIICTAIVLAIMIIPFAASYSSVYIKNIPLQLKENAYALGATGREVIWKINLPYTKKGIFSAHLLALGKALGETMIVAILIGNTNKMPTSLSDTGNTVTSMLINQAESSGDLKLSALFAIALFLFVFTACINSLAMYLNPQNQ